MSNLITRFNRINDSSKKSNLNTIFNDSKEVIDEIKELIDFESLPPSIDFINSSKALLYLKNSLLKIFNIDECLLNISVENELNVEFPISTDYLIGLCCELKSILEYEEVVKAQSIEVEYKQNGIKFKTKIELVDNDIQSEQFINNIFSTLREQLDLYGTKLELEHIQDILQGGSILNLMFTVKKIESLTLIEKSDAFKKVVKYKRMINEV